MRVLGIVASLAIAATAFAADVHDRLKESTTVLNEIMATPDKGIPSDLLAKAECVIVIPSMKKGAFIVGAQFGKGFAECRQGAGWGAPSAMEMEGGSVGFQIGGSATDLILLVMNRKGMDRLMGDKFTLGGDASVAAGPVGRTSSAETNARMDAEMLSWSRSKGVFGGISLKGASLRPDKSENKALYGKEVAAKEILSGGVKAPADATVLAAALTKLSPSTGADRKQ